MLMPVKVAVALPCRSRFLSFFRARRPVGRATRAPTSCFLSSQFVSPSGQPYKSYGYSPCKAAPLFRVCRRRRVCAAGGRSLGRTVRGPANYRPAFSALSPKFPANPKEKKTGKEQRNHNLYRGSGPLELRPRAKTRNFPLDSRMNNGLRIP
jgi:hypothetical protein